MKKTTDGKYDGFSIDELEVKRKLAARLIIKPLKCDWKDDPRAEKALVHYRAEYAKINSTLLRKLREQREAAGEPEPPRQTIGMANLKLRGKALQK